MNKPLSIIIALFSLATTATAADRTIRLKVIETSDVHGHFFPYDFIERQPLKGTLARVNTYVNRQRQEYGDRLLLIDNGDILQGQPTCYWTNYVATASENVGASIVNYMRYDAETVGNHDIETGHPVYDKWIREVRCPLLGANIVSKADGNPYVHPYSVHYKDGVKIAIIGMITPTISSWLSESLWQGLEFKEMTACARKWIKYVRETEKPDLIFGLFHSGWNGGIIDGELEENASERVAKEVDGFDIIFFGHDHQVHNLQIKNDFGKDVLCIDPSCYARNIAEATIELTYKGGKLTHKDIKGRIVSMDEEAVDTKMTSHFQPQIDEIKAYVDQQIGTFANETSTRDSYFGSSAFTDFIHNIQLSVSKADISFCAPLSFDTKINAGPITVSDMFKLYRFENRLYVLNMTGREIQKHLEMSYDLWVNTMKNPSDHLVLLNNESKGDQQRQGFLNYTFNFDSAAGIDYEVDVTKPNGEKVHIMRMSNGLPFSLDKTYRVAMNSYRGNGGGELLTHGAGIPKEKIEERIIYRSDLDFRHYLIEAIKQIGTVTPKANNNWKFVPEEWTIPAAQRDRKLLFGE